MRGSSALSIRVVDFAVGPHGEAGWSSGSAFWYRGSSGWTKPVLCELGDSFSWSSTSHFPVIAVSISCHETGFSWPDIKNHQVLFSSSKHGKSWYVGSPSLLLLVFTLSFWEFWPIVPCHVHGFRGLLAHASTTQRPWGDARDDQNPWVLEQVTTETPGKRSWSGISKEGISALRCNAFGCFRWSMSHGSRASAHQVVIWTPSERFECLNASRLLFQCLVAVQWHVFLKMFEAVAPPSSSI